MRTVLDKAVYAAQDTLEVVGVKRLLLGIGVLLVVLALGAGAFLLTRPEDPAVLRAQEEAARGVAGEGTAGSGDLAGLNLATCAQAQAALRELTATHPAPAEAPAAVKAEAMQAGRVAAESCAPAQADLVKSVLLAPWVKATS